MDTDSRPRALVEAWDGTHWQIDEVPQPGAMGDMLFGVSALSARDVWSVTGDPPPLTRDRPV